MDRWEALYQFWSRFGIDAYEENTVPDYDLSENPVEYKAQFPYITYQAVSSGFDEDAIVNASIWTRSTSWLEADTLADDIERDLKNGGVLLRFDTGAMWITAGAPFAQNMGDPDDDMIKRKLLNVTYHFL